MAGFRATNIVPEEGYRRSKKLGVQVKGFADTTVGQLLVDRNSDFILMIFHQMRRYKDDFDALASIPGIAAYAKIQEDDPTYDVAAEFVSMTAAIVAVKAEILSTFPVDGDGYLLEKKWNAGETYDFRQFTPAQTSNIRTLLTALSGTLV